MRRSEEIFHGSAGGGVTPGNRLRGEIRLNEPMRRHTSWRTGGVAQRMYIPADLRDLCQFLHSLASNEPIHMIGLGSNLLVRDGGLNGTVILLHGALKQICIEQRKMAGLSDVQDASPCKLIYAEAGVASPKVARFAATHDLMGAEFLAGIPGTMGGALAMNAGCYGGETWHNTAMVLTVDRSGQLRERSATEYTIGYRHVALKHEYAVTPPDQEWFVAAWLKLSSGDGAASRNTIKNLLTKRIASQPLSLPNAGSVFRNPPGDYAARLIEASGMKGATIGGAAVSLKHANFIVNSGAATAADIENLIEKIQQVVLREQGIQLEREVRIIGERL